MKEVEFKGGRGVYEVSLAPKAKVTRAGIEKAVTRFKLEKVELTIRGDVAKDDKGVWLTSSESGDKFLLANREKKDDKDKPPDVLAEIQKQMDAGKTSFEIAGELKTEKDASSIRLDSAKAVEKKEEKKEEKDEDEKEMK